jgi:phosphoribosylanthranilate isomerase
MNDLQVKVCGITRAEDGNLAISLGADYLGFNFYPKSSRFISLQQYRTLASHLPTTQKVAVVVEPDSDSLSEILKEDFDRVQIHFREETPLEQVADWSKQVSPEKLWLAPKLPPESTLNEALLPLADTFFFDTFRKDGFGGTGHTGDWEKFAAFQQKHPDKIWILAGGLNPENILEAVKKTKTHFVDLCSGVESSPGIKDEAKLKSFLEQLKT